MNRNFYPDLARRQSPVKQDDEEKEKALKKNEKGRVNFANSTFSNCVFIFNFAGPEDRKEDNDGI